MNVIYLPSNMKRDNFNQEEFASIQNQLQNDLEKAEKGNTDFLDLQQLDDALEATIQKYELNSLQ